MKSRDKAKNISEEEIDDIAVGQTNDESAWEEPVHVHWEKLTLESFPFPVSLPSELAQQAAFYAELHGELSTETWLMSIIHEQVKSEVDFYIYLAEHTHEYSKESLPLELPGLVTFFAKRHREPSEAVWITHIIGRRLELEEADFTRLKRELKVEI